MENELSNEILTKQTEESLNELKFVWEIGKLKHLPRAGWTIMGRDITRPETVSGHMYRMSIIAMTLTEDYNGQTYDRNKVIQMTLIHDMAECIVGDITPFDGVSEHEKHLREMNAMNYLTSLLPKFASHEFTKLFQEYETRHTIESIIVKELDLIDVMLQAFEYERSEFNDYNRIVKFQEFFDNGEGRIRHPQLLRMVNALKKERDDHWNKIVITNGDDKSNCN